MGCCQQARWPFLCQPLCPPPKLGDSVTCRLQPHWNCQGVLGWCVFIVQSCPKCVILLHKTLSSWAVSLHGLVVLSAPLAKLGAQLSLLPAHLPSGPATCPVSSQWPGLAPAAGILLAPSTSSPNPDSSPQLREVVDQDKTHGDAESGACSRRRQTENRTVHGIPSSPCSLQTPCQRLEPLLSPLFLPD